MRTTYYLRDSLEKDGILTLSFFKDFYYAYALGLQHDACILRLHGTKTGHVAMPVLYDGAPFQVEVVHHGNGDELILTDEDGKQTRILCDRIEQEAFENTREELIGFIQFLEKELHDKDSLLRQKDTVTGSIASFCKKELDHAQTILNHANQLPITKQKESEKKVLIYKHLLQLIAGNNT